MTGVVATDSPWPAILTTAIRAPSPHNVQPWRVRVLDARTAELFVEKRRTLPDEDVTGSFMILTMGVFIESVRIAAAHHGFALDEHRLEGLEAFTAARLRSRPEPLLAFARLALRETSAAGAPFSPALFEARRTSRLPYGPEQVPIAARDRLAAIASAWGHVYRQTQDPAQIERVLALNVAAVFEDLNHRPYRDELAGWLRYSARTAAATRDGLDARCMNQHPAELWAAFHVPGVLRWPLTRVWFARRYRRQIGPVPTLGFLCGGFWEPADAYPAGRLLIHFWLECTRLGYAIHPYGNLVTNRPIADRVRADTGFDDIWLAFKIGRSAEAPASHRRTLEEVLL